MYKTSFSVGHFDLIYWLTIIHIIQPTQCKVTKCCPLGSVLNTKNDFSCEFSSFGSLWDSYNIFPSSIPNCTSSSHVLFEDEFYIELNGCLDKDLNNHFVSLSCSNKPTIDVHLVNKCCPFGQTYDYSGRICVRNPYSQTHFKHIFGNTSVAFTNNVPNCSENEVFVEYFSTVHNIFFIENSLEINGNNLSSVKYCIDDLVNIYPIHSSESGKKHIIVRSCRPRSVCNEITCMRRCCKVDQFMEAKPGGNKNCLNHPDKMNLVPVFYNVSYPLNKISSHMKQSVVTGKS